MSKGVVFLAMVGVALLASATQATPERIPDGAGVVRGLLVLFGSLALVTSLLGWALDFGGKRLEQERERFKAAGVPAAARILQIEPRGGGNDSWHAVTLTLEVAVPGRPTYVTRHEDTVSAVFSGQLRPNEWLPVMVSPDNPEELLVRWGEAATPPAWVSP